MKYIFLIFQDLVFYQNVKSWILPLDRAVPEQGCRGMTRIQSTRSYLAGRGEFCALNLLRYTPRGIVWAFILGVSILFLDLAQASPRDPRQLVESTTHKIMDILVKEKENLDRDSGRIYVLVENFLIPHFDFVGMSRFVIGKHWKAATEPQRSEFVVTFKNLLVRTYAGALRNYTGRQISFLPERSGDSEDSKILIRSEVENPGGEPIFVNYRMWQKGDAWLVYDINVEGVSLLTNFRSQLSNEVSQYGMDETIRKMREKTEQMKSKTLETIEKGS